MAKTRAVLVWYLIAAMAALTLVSFTLTGLTVDPYSNPTVFILIAVLLAINWFYRSVRPDPRLRIATEIAAQVLLILLFGILLTYAAIAVASPYRDAELHFIDQLLGFDRRTYLDFFMVRPWLTDLMDFAYLSLLPQFALVPLVLSVSGQMVRLHTLLLATGIALILTSAIAVFLPAVNAFFYLDMTPAALAELAIHKKLQVATLEALRTGTMHAIRLDDLEGLISFPSFHTAGALLFAWALVRVPYIRWPVLWLNGTLIAATPINGGHYFVDLIGGTAVAGLSIAASVWLCRRAEAREASVAVTSRPLPENLREAFGRRTSQWPSLGLASDGIVRLLRRLGLSFRQ